MPLLTANLRPLPPPLLSIRIKYVLALALLLFASLNAKAQERCGTVEYNQQLRERNVLFENNEQFEQWIEQHRRFNKLDNSTKRIETGPYQVPVVVHVIHNGEPLGTGVNISDAQILSQIAVLNQDYTRTNADASSTPAEFQPVAGLVEIEFVLARRNPEGLATNGIVRVQGAKTQWDRTNDDYQLKAQSYWPAEDYLNIWVTDLGSGYLGYAQFPVSNLPGVEDASNNRLTDGVVIDYKAFGTIDAGPFSLDNNYNRGRTTTHEIGHFFGLRHIWGDDSGACSGTDYVDDTPNQASNSSGCPTHPRATCSSNDMFQNYMDYTNDVCMNLFTSGQVSRIITVIENSPRRVSLLTSPALQYPLPFANDLGIKQIITPASSECDLNVTPSIEVQNYGSNAITSTQVRMLVNSIPIETLNLPLSLDPLESETVTFTNQPLGAGNTSFTFEILQTNGGADGSALDNVKAITTYVPESISTPFAEPFDALPTEWIVNNPDGKLTWQIATAPKATSGNTALKLEFYNYEEQGEIDIITTPVFDLSAETAAYLTFDIAHARFLADPSNDGLRVFVLANCNSDLFEGTEVFSKAGAALATANATNAAFTPLDDSQWRKEIVNLSAFVGAGKVQLAFVAVNDYGNNLYVDNIALITSTDEDLALLSITSPSPVTCDESPAPQLHIQNVGTKTITNFKVQQNLNGGATTSATITGVSLQPGDLFDLTLDEVELEDGENVLEYTLTDPNNLFDANPSNDSKTMHVVYNDARDRVPLRENFDINFDGWTAVNPDGGTNWTPAATNFNTSFLADGFTNSTLDDELWFVTPVIDFSDAQKASLFYDLSYASAGGTNDRFRILASTDCGTTFNRILVNVTGDDITGFEATGSWTPATAADWTKKFVNLNTFAGEPEVRFAFIFNNSNGNNLYIDNIELYASDNPTPPAIDDLFVIYTPQEGGDGAMHIVFNLPERQAVGYEVIDMLGRPLVDVVIADVLNQEFPIYMDNAAAGVYIVRLAIGGKYYARKVYVEP